jgi:hypothetical protein
VHTKIVFLSSRNHWWHLPFKWLLTCMKKPLSMSGTNILVICPKTLFTILFIIFHFWSHQTKCLFYVPHVQSIKLINFYLVSLVSQAMHLLNSSIQIFGIPLIVLVSMVLIIIYFLLTITLNAYGFILWKQRSWLWQFSHNLKN